MPTDITNAARADALQSIRDRLEECFAEAREILEGTPASTRAREWLSHLDRVLGTEPSVTIDDTIAELRGL